MNTNYYQDKRFEFTEVAICIEDFYYLNKGKFAIPIIEPELKIDAPYQNESGRASTANIINYGRKHGIQNATESNYVELTVPKYIAESIKDSETLLISKGTTFIITFIGGELNNQKIIGVCE